MANIDVSVETNDQPTPPPTDPNTCPSCHSHYRDDELEQLLWVCGQCGHHFPMRARARIASLADVEKLLIEIRERGTVVGVGLTGLAPDPANVEKLERLTTAVGF